MRSNWVYPNAPPSSDTFCVFLGLISGLSDTRSKGSTTKSDVAVIKKSASRSGSRIYGYARVSTLDQDLTIQHAALDAAGCMTIFEEKKSGTRRDGRTELQVLLECVREGDTVIVTRIDRLARSMKDLQDIVHELKEKGVSLKATEQPIDTSSAAGKAFLDMLALFAEFETNLRRERQLEGIQQAKARGVYKGRKPRIEVARVKALRDAGRGPAAIAKELKMARSSVYRVLGLSVRTAG
jgi:DNA invertase Pin-like site-specific DNA recombinase